MTAEIELLPLPKWMSNYTIPPDSSLFHKDVILADRMHDYARANVANAIAPLQAEIKALRAEVDVLKAENARLRDALVEIRNRSWTGVMRSDQSDLEIVLADICLFVDVVLWKEDKND